jgi:hypothetical protein
MRDKGVSDRGQTDQQFIGLPEKAGLLLNVPRRFD